jgi:hypothetical protein
MSNRSRPRIGGVCDDFVFAAKTSHFFPTVFYPATTIRKILAPPFQNRRV